LIADFATMPTIPSAVDLQFGMVGKRAKVLKPEHVEVSHFGSRKRE